MPPHPTSTHLLKVERELVSPAPPALRSRRHHHLSTVAITAHSPCASTGPAPTEPSLIQRSLAGPKHAPPTVATHNATRHAMQGGASPLPPPPRSRGGQRQRPRPHLSRRGASIIPVSMVPRGNVHKVRVSARGGRPVRGRTY